jgi:hypothetical protein
MGGGGAQTRRAEPSQRARANFAENSSEGRAQIL